MRGLLLVALLLSLGGCVSASDAVRWCLESRYCQGMERRAYAPVHILFLPPKPPPTPGRTMARDQPAPLAILGAGLPPTGGYDAD